MAKSFAHLENSHARATEKIGVERQQALPTTAPLTNSLDYVSVVVPLVLFGFWALFNGGALRARTWLFVCWLVVLAWCLLLMQRKLVRERRCGALCECNRQPVGYKSSCFDSYGDLCHRESSISEGSSADPLKANG